MLHILCLALVLWLNLIVQQVGFISGVMFPYLLTTHLFLHLFLYYMHSLDPFTHSLSSHSLCSPSLGLLHRSL